MDIYFNDPITNMVKEEQKSRSLDTFRERDRDGVIVVDYLGTFMHGIPFDGSPDVPGGHDAGLGFPGACG
jgi:hypothetical protein